MSKRRKKGEREEEEKGRERTRETQVTNPKQALIKVAGATLINPIDISTKCKRGETSLWHPPICNIEWQKETTKLY